MTKSLLIFRSKPSPGAQTAKDKEQTRWQQQERHWIHAVFRAFFDVDFGNVHDELVWLAAVFNTQGILSLHRVSVDALNGVQG